MHLGGPATFDVLGEDIAWPIETFGLARLAVVGFGGRHRGARQAVEDAASRDYRVAVAAFGRLTPVSRSLARQMRL